MSKYESSAELAGKAESEGLEYFIFGYGLSEAELPDDLPPKIRNCFLRVLAVQKDMDQISRYLDYDE